MRALGRAGGDKGSLREMVSNDERDWLEGDEGCGDFYDSAQ